MTIEFMVGLQVVADIVLLCAIFFLVWAVNRERKKDIPGLDEQTFAEFKQLIDESRRSSDDLFETLGEVKKLAAALDAKERRLMDLVQEPDTKDTNQNAKSPDRGEKYEEVVEMARHGAAVKEIAEALELTEGEIALILGLHRKKNENSTHRSSTP